MTKNRTTHERDTTSSYFGSLAEDWKELYEGKASFQDRFELFIGGIRIRLSPPGQVLDFGCGPGVMSLALAKMGYQVSGVDISLSMVAQATEERNRQKTDGASFRACDARAFAVEPETYDAIICSSVLQYVPDDDELLGKLSAALKPRGFLLISIPHQGSLLGMIEAPVARLMGHARFPGREFLNYSLRRYGLRKFMNMLRKHGLTPVEHRFFEVPKLGKWSIPLSRISFIGVMLLVVAQKIEHPAPAATGHSDSDLPKAQRALSRKNLWDDLPHWLRRGVGYVTAGLNPRYLLGKTFRRTHDFLEETEWWDTERSRAYQLEQLRRVCTIAWERTAFYRQQFDSVGFHPKDLGCIEDLSVIPLIDKETLREHLDEMCAVSPRSAGVDFSSTGGTGGTPLRFFIGADRSAIEYAYLVASWRRTGYSLSTPQAVFRGEIVPEDRAGLRHSYHPILRRHFYSNFHMTEGNMRRYLKHIGTIGPCYLHVYPSSVLTLARYIERSGTPAPRNILGILAGSETVYPADRQLAERLFGVRYSSWYGHTEKLVMAAECEQSTDYHVWPTYGYFELLDDQARPVTTPGQRGEIVGTGFINTVVPFIRYRTGDYATYVDDHCSACGRQHLIIREIRGHRTHEMLVTSGGSQISWTALNMHDDTFRNVRQFQFYQDTPGKAVLRVVPAPRFSQADVEKIYHALNMKLTGQITFNIKTVDAIPLTAIGKSTFVEQNLDLENLNNVEVTTA